MKKKVVVIILIVIGAFTAAVFLFSEDNNMVVSDIPEKIVKSFPLVGNSALPDFSEDFVLYDVPFTPQAPFAEWDDERQQDGCEEASALMAMRWVEGRGLTLNEARRIIIEMSDYELAKYGEFHDTSAKDTIKRIFKDYFDYDKVRLGTSVDAEDIKSELSKGNLVIVHVNGQLLGNPYFTAPGPEYHVLVVKGFDEKKKEFITNDPGTKRGNSYRYPYQVLINALRDYPTGFHRPIPDINKTMIVVEP